ncbi:MAG: LysM peptidoglycan-binding domain-containing protein [Chloroflexi bacterium]|nr:MAG: LysM peptidoglycan-binding domain-containing protein [Chloroflexota bacterium]
MRKFHLILMLALLAFIFAMNSALASPPNQDSWGETYIVQADDWLSKIADKFYGDAFMYPAIVEATTIKAMSDDTFTVIDNPNLIHVGQKLWVPTQSVAEQIMSAGNILDRGDVTTFKYFIHPDVGVYEFRVRWNSDGSANSIEIYDAQIQTSVQPINFAADVFYDRNIRAPDAFLEAADYNFDGYTDFRHVAEIGGRGVYNTHMIWLFDAQTNRFVLDETLSSLRSVRPVPKKKELVSHIWDPTSEAFLIYQYREQSPVLVRDVEKCLLAEKYCTDFLDKAAGGDASGLIEQARQSRGDGQDFGALVVSQPDADAACLSIFVPDERTGWWSTIGEQVVIQGNEAQCRAAEEY